MSKGICIRSVTNVHMPKNIFSTKQSEESVCESMPSISAKEIPAANTPLADTEPRMSVITETMSPKTSPKITSPVPVTGLLPLEPTVNLAAQSSMVAPISASSTSRLESSSIEQITVEADQQKLISKSISKEDVVSSSNIDSSPSAFVQSSSSEVSTSLVAVHPLSAYEQLICTEDQKSSTDKSSLCRVSPEVSPIQPSPNKSANEASHIAQVQTSSSPHLTSPTSAKMSPTKKLAEKTVYIQDSVSSSIAPSSSSLTLTIDDSNQSLAVGRSSLSFGSPFAGFESPPDKYITGKSHVSIFDELLGSSQATDPVAASKSYPSGQNMSEPDQSLCASEPSSPGSTTTLIMSRLSPTKLNVNEACQKVQQDPSSPMDTSALSPKHTAEKTSQASKIPEQNSPPDNAPVSTASEGNMDKDNVKEPSFVDSPSTVTVFDESSFDQSRTFSRIVKPIVAYTPSPTRISFSETVCLSPSPESGSSVPQSSASVLKREEAQELICISSSTSPGTNSEKKLALVSPSVSIQSCTRTSTTSPQSVLTDMGQSGPAIAQDLRTPEKIRSSQSSVLALSTPSCNSSVTSSPQMAPASSSPETFDATYNSHIGVRQLRKDSAVSSCISSPLSSSKTSDVTLTEPQDEPNSDVEDDQESSSLIAPSPRRSVRLARRLSTDSTTLDAVQEEGSESGRSPGRPESCKSTRRTSDRLIGAGRMPIFDPATDEGDNDDAVSVKSAASAAESVSSRASTVSNRSQTRKRSSFTRLEMRKSSVRPSFRPLQVILSDEEMTSPTKSEIGFERQSEVVERKYASSEPGDLSSGSRRSKRSRTSSVASDEDDRLSTSSERQTKKMRKRSTRRQSDKNLLNAAMLASPEPQKSKLKRLVSSTPMKVSVC